MTAVLQELLEKQSTAVQFFHFLASRNRSSERTDINQFFSVMRAEQKYTITREVLMDCFLALCNCGIGVLSGDSTGRTKFSWAYWLFPIFHLSNPQILLALEIKHIDKLREDKNAYRLAKEQAKAYAFKLSKPSPDPDVKLDVVFRQKQVIEAVSKQLEDFSLEEIIEELKRRNYYVTLTTVPPIRERKQL